MNPRNRIWLLAVVVVGLGVVALGYLLGVAPKIEEIKAADAARAEAASTNALYERQLEKLKKDYEGIDDIQAKLDELDVQLPAEAGYETYLALTNELASASGTVLTTFAWSVPTLFTADSAGIIAAAATGGEDAELPVEPELTGVAPDGALVSMPWAITVKGKLDGLRSFIGSLQRTDRLFLITGFTINPSTGTDAPPDEYELVVNGMTFVLMNSKATEADEEDAEQPAEEPTPAPTPTSTPTPTPTSSATPTP